ncbi:Urb2/Npa2 family-domain-containing protein [Xylaria palmicola]|nr:Urb2/Npa2 family-domain-containing protein [Xylaria palmicola]
MGAMDLDEGSQSQQLALIRAVRTLDDDSSSTLPERIHKLWLLLAAAKHTRLHSVEENILRWLLKQMSGSTESAELVRRYPLTWTILAHVFPKIPAQALGRSLAYARFVSTLNNTLGDVTAQDTQPSIPATEDGAATAKKRKRGIDWPITLGELRTPPGCLRTASEVFEALVVLLQQGSTQSGAVTSEKGVGAEHIKSLFSSSGDDTRDITAKLLLICDKALSTTDGGLVNAQAAWIDTLAAVWSLRLHSKEDSLEFARRIYERASLILAKIEGDDYVWPSDHVHGTCREIWITQLRRFLSMHFIRPARQRFSADRNIDTLKLALEIAHNDAAASSTVMWSIAAGIPRDASVPKSKIEHDEWAESVFQLVVANIHPLERQKRNGVFYRLLDTALQTQSIPNTDTLRLVYQQHALNGDETDWTLLSKILACDADVFLAAQDPGAIFDKISRVSNGGIQKDEVVSNVILPLQDAFAHARDLTGFVTHWFRSLCTAESVEQSIWFDPIIREHLAAILPTSLMSTQLLRLLEGLDSTSSKAGEILVMLDGICAGLTDENMIADVDSKIIKIMDRDWEGVIPSVLALRWKVLGYLASWGTSTECNQIWKKAKSDLKQIVKKSALTDPGAFEAFSCCYKLCLSNHIGGKYEDDLTKMVGTMLGRLESAINSEADLQLLGPYVELVFSHLPRLSEQPKQEVNTLADQIVKLFWLISYKLSPLLGERCLEYTRRLIHNYDVTDEEPMMDALMAPLLDAFDNSEGQSGWTDSRSPHLFSVLLEFPIESWTRGRRKRMMGSWKKHKSAISSYAAKDSKYALSILRLLIRIMEQPTFYEDMEFIDLVDICSSMVASDPTLTPLVEKLVDTTIRQVLTNTNEFIQAYLVSASKYAKSLKPGKHSAECTPILLLKSLTAMISSPRSSNKSFVDLGIDPKIYGQKLAKLVERALNDFASAGSETSKASLTDEQHRLILTSLDAAQAIDGDATSQMKIELSGDALTRLERATDTMVLRDPAIVWKLRSFLIKQSPDRHTTESFCAILDEGSDEINDEMIYELVDAYVQKKSQSVRDQLLSELLGSDKLIGGCIGPLLAARRLLELHHGPNAADESANKPGGLDLAKVYDHFTSALTRTGSFLHFKQITEIMLYLLDKHANSITQYNIEATLASVVEVCSARGPNIQGSKVAGEIFAALFKLVALIIRRRRLRLTGHFHLLLATLRALLTVLLSDPGSSISSRRSTPPRHPPWLLARLQPRHAERFARLLTLVCEPSAASVARARTRSELDSAAAVAKRAAGQYMYLVLEVYVKLQLEVEVPREMRRALEIGIFSVLDITSEGCRKVLNESLDASGRAVFRALFAEYRKFGKWKGV